MSGRPFNWLHRVNHYLLRWLWMRLYEELDKDKHHARWGLKFPLPPRCKSTWYTRPPLPPVLKGQIQQ